MPYKSEKIPFPSEFFDKRVKLLPCMKEMIHILYAEGCSIKSLARRFNVDKRLIQFELFPERKLKNLEDRAKRGGSKIYYEGGEKWNEQMRTHRRRKHEIISKIIQNGEQ